MAKCHGGEKAGCGAAGDQAGSDGSGAEVRNQCLLASYTTRRGPFLTILVVLILLKGARRGGHASRSSRTIGLEGIRPGTHL